MNDELKKEILSLLESPELREYLLAPPEKLCCAQYAEIICGAPVSLYRKRELLLRLKAETPEEDLWAILGALHCIEDALKALEQADASDAYLSVELIGYDAEERRTDTIDGPYPVRSLAEARPSEPIAPTAKKRTGRWGRIATSTTTTGRQMTGKPGSGPWSCMT